MNAAKNGSDGAYELEIPLDASEIDDIEPGQSVKVLVQHRDGTSQVATAELAEKGKGAATFQFEERPGSLQVIVGPEEASAEELLGLQTLRFALQARRWEEQEELELDPVQIPSYYWHWWLRWCRTFTVRGRITCPDGSPVPGAKVCAYDVDSFWWWFSTQQVGCATTDPTGAFEIKFRWCCGWWPWWWWQHRHWQLDPTLAERLRETIQQNLEVPPRELVEPTPKPDFSFFEDLLSETNVGERPRRSGNDLVALAGGAQAERRSLESGQAPFDPGALETARLQLKEQLSPVPELEEFRLWPWHPWHPWHDCSPDLIFRATQNCGDEEEIIVDETWWDARWNVSTTTNVTLVASEACCVDPTPQPEGNCINLTHACGRTLSTIGGNLGATATPAGYKNPGTMAKSGDRPWAGNIRIRGDFGTLAGADYYELEWSDDGGTTWNAMPAGTVAGFNRRYYGPQLPSGPTDVHSVPFNVKLIDGRNVIESRQHFEATHGAGTWEVLSPGSRWWVDHKNLLAVWRTKDNFPDGTYHLRIKSWQRTGEDELSNPQILAQCGSDQEQDNNLVLTLDNRVVGSGSGHPPSRPDHPTGPDTVHLRTLEPDTDIIDVRIAHPDGSVSDTIGTCGEVSISEGDDLLVDFMAHDPDGHLAYYTLVATFGENMVQDLLALATPSPSPLSSPPVPAAAQVGPTYGDARANGAVAPTWEGGAMRLRVPATEAFEITCCYQLELRAYKRTIVNCNGNFVHRNRSEYSFMVQV